MKKQNQFYIYKFTSDRLKDKDFKLNLDIEEAKINGEIISLSDSQLIRTIRPNFKKDLERLTEIKFEIKKIKKQPHSKNNSDRLKELYQEKNKILFLPEIISITMTNNAHYKYLFKNGLKLNDKTYFRFLCGSAQGRKNKVLFVDEETITKIKPILENGYDKTQKMNISKINAYFGLYSSNALEVSDLNVCVVKDFEVILNKNVDYIFQGKNKDWVQNISLPISFKPHDGMGIITVEGAKKWMQEIEADYIPSQIGIRHSYIKGMVAVFDVKRFMKEIVKFEDKFIIKDAWGNTVDARKIDLFLTTSQFKLWKNYKSWEDFVSKCKENKLRWGISKVSPKIDNNYCFSNYQYLQSLEIEDEDIKDICQPHIDWIKNVLDNNVSYTLLYLLGKGVNNITKITDIQNSYIRALILNNDMIDDPYIKNKIYNSINKKIRSSYAGKVLIEGNYQTMVADPYGLAEHIFGLEVNGLLKDKEHYSCYWNNKNVKHVDACRSPLTHYSEHNILNLQNNDEVNKWYQYQTSGIIYSMWGDDTIRHADSDFDLDLVFTTNNPTFLKCVMKNTYPITYKKKPTPVSIVTDDELFKADLLSFDNDIGVITNYSTSMYAMLPCFKKDSNKYNIILDRLKITRMLQGNAIDKAKGIEVKDVPTTWLKYQKTLKTDTQQEKNNKRYFNKLVINKKPYFMIWLYPKLRKQYIDYLNKANLYCKITFGMTLDALKQKRPKTKEEKNFFKVHYKYMPVNVSKCVMNKISWYMESVGKDIIQNINSNKDCSTFADLLSSDCVDRNDEIYQQLLNLYNEYCLIKRTYNKTNNNNKDKHEEDNFQDLNILNKMFKEKALQICSDIKHLIACVVDITYRLYPLKNKDFLWDVFDSDVLINLIEKRPDKLYIPMINTEGDIDYLGTKYKNMEVVYDI